MPRHSGALLACWVDPAGSGPGGQDGPAVEPADRVHVLLGHMGGPFWARLDEGAWSIPKGEFDPAREAAPAAARREFVEETGITPPRGPLLALGEFAQPSGKRVHAFALEFTDRVPFVASNAFYLEWPRGSGRTQSFPEIDRAVWFPRAEARRRALSGQVPVLDALFVLLSERDIAG